MPSLDAAGVTLVRWSDLDDTDRKVLVEEFHERIFPVLTPLGVDPSHPFPYISDLSLNLAVVVRRREDTSVVVRRLDDAAVVARRPDGAGTRFARVKMPSLLPRFVQVPGADRFVPVEDVVAAHLDVLFPGMQVVSVHTFRVTRNADLTPKAEEADDLLAAVEMELRRHRFQRAVRLEVSDDLPEAVVDLLAKELELEADGVYRSRGPLDLRGLFDVAELDRPDLHHPPLVPVTEPCFAVAEAEDADLFAAVRRHDVLVHHPYTSFASSVEAFVAQAASDPLVLAVKMTLYRTSGDSPVVASLVRAAEAGKQVAVIVELKARFDERANIGWARRLEKAGVHVVYGLAGLKTHAKVVLVVRDDPDGLRRYCHIGTGNYNQRTARHYEDLGLFTADATIGDDLIDLFNYLTGFSHEPGFRRLLVAPHDLRGALVRLVEGERRAPAGTGRIVLKTNSVVDPELIAALEAAAEDGVDIDLVVRGICCLLPGGPRRAGTAAADGGDRAGRAPRPIRVRSVVGRFLEHSRIAYFANGEGEGRPAWYIGSADLMPRNFDQRVEVLAPVDDPVLRARLRQIVDVNLADDALAWELTRKGRWRRVRPASGAGRVDAHEQLIELNAERAAPVPRPR